MTAQTNPLARHGGLSYLHIPARDQQKSAAFYEKLLGWTIDQRSNGYRFSAGDGLLIGGFSKGETGVGAGVGFVPYFYVEDIEAALERATSSGGEIVDPPRAEGDIRVAEIRDPAGNRLGLWRFA